VHVPARSNPDADRPGGRFAEIFANGDAAVKTFPDLASVLREIRRTHPGRADLIAIGVSANPAMKIVEDSCGFVTVLIGLPRSIVETFDVDDEVVIAFDHGMMRAAGVVGFLWEDDSGPPPESEPRPRRPEMPLQRGFRILRR